MAGQNSTAILQGWRSIAGFLGLPLATVQRWARTGMPVRKQGRFTVADKEELQQWLGRQSHMPAPAQVVDANTDLAAALQQSISATRPTNRAAKDPPKKKARRPRS